MNGNYLQIRIPETDNTDMHDVEPDVVHFAIFSGVFRPHFLYCFLIVSDGTFTTDIFGKFNIDYSIYKTTQLYDFMSLFLR